MTESRRHPGVSAFELGKQCFIDALASYSIGDFKGAKAKYLESLAHVPDRPSTLANLAAAYFSLCEIDNAREAALRAIALDPEHAAAFLTLGAIEMTGGNSEAALRNCERVIELSPSHVEAWTSKAGILCDSGNYEDALQAYSTVVALKPTSQALSSLAMCFGYLNRFDEANRTIAEALKADPANVDCHNNYGRILHRMNRHDEAMVAFDTALSLNPSSSSAWLGKAGVLYDLERYSDALACYQSVPPSDTHYPKAKFGRAIIHLLEGDYKRGWIDYEARWAALVSGQNLHPNLPSLTCLDEARGRTVLVWAEAGAGDVLQFCRYLDLLSDLASLVVFECPIGLERLLQTQFRAHVIRRGNPPGVVDYAIPLMSLPLLFGTTLETIPHPDAYLSVSEVLVTMWRRKLNISNTRLNIGICCSGNPKHLSDRNRSAPLSAFQPLTELGNCYVVQTDLRPDDSAFLASTQRMSFVGDKLGGFDDTAAVLRNMDVVVTVDTSLVHLAGSLGINTWVLICSAPEWRWLRDRSDSPWYASVRIARQPHFGDWLGAIQTVADQISRDCKTA